MAMTSGSGVVGLDGTMLFIYLTFFIIILCDRNADCSREVDFGLFWWDCFSPLNDFHRPLALWFCELFLFSSPCCAAVSFSFSLGTSNPGCVILSDHLDSSGWIIVAFLHNIFLWLWLTSSSYKGREIFILDPTFSLGHRVEETGCFPFINHAAVLFEGRRVALSLL